MEKRYVCFSIQSTGSNPANNSILSIGASIVGDSDKRFYRELQPINEEFVLSYIESASSRLDTLKRYPNQRFVDPTNDEFYPREVIRFMRENGCSPFVAMEDLRQWIQVETFNPIPVFPRSHESVFINYYLGRFNTNDLFLFGSLDLESFYKGHEKDLSAVLDRILQGEVSHHALEDAVLYAQSMEGLIDIKK